MLRGQENFTDDLKSSPVKAKLVSGAEAEPIATPVEEKPAQRNGYVDGAEGFISKRSAEKR